MQDPGCVMAEPISDQTAYVFKICPLSDWRAAEATGAYSGSPDDVRDGFIHLSTAGQLSGTLTKHFPGRAGLVLLAFKADTLGAALRFEPSRGGQLFPHLYRPLPAVALAWLKPLALAANGSHAIPNLSEFVAGPAL